MHIKDVNFNLFQSFFSRKDKKLGINISNLCVLFSRWNIVNKIYKKLSVFALLKALEGKYVRWISFDKLTEIFSRKKNVRKTRKIVGKFSFALKKYHFFIFVFKISRNSRLFWQNFEIWRGQKGTHHWATFQNFQGFLTKNRSTKPYKRLDASRIMRPNLNSKIFRQTI